MKTLATQAASSTFTGNRATLDTEFQSLKTEIDRQAANVGLVSGRTSNSQMMSTSAAAGRIRQRQSQRSI